MMCFFEHDDPIGQSSFKPLLYIQDMNKQCEKKKTLITLTEEKQSVLVVNTDLSFAKWKLNLHAQWVWPASTKHHNQLPKT